VLEAARRLRYSNIRYPGSNYVSAYRWRGGVDPVEDRPARYDPALHTALEVLVEQLVDEVRCALPQGCIHGAGCLGASAQPLATMSRRPADLPKDLADQAVRG
jgi:hypothetical protein